MVHDRDSAFSAVLSQSPMENTANASFVESLLINLFIIFYLNVLKKDFYLSNITKVIFAYKFIIINSYQLLLNR